MEALSTQAAARLLGVTPRRLRYWRQTRLLRASQDPRQSEPRFAFPDLVRARALLGLLESGVSLRRLRKSVESLRDRIPDLGEPLAKRISYDSASGRLVARYQGVLMEPSGQTVFDFGATEQAAVQVDYLGDARHWFERGCLLDTDPERIQEAVRAYETAIRLNPQLSDAHCNLGAIHFQARRLEQARLCFERALESAPLHYEANLNLAHVLEEEEFHAAALCCYKRLLARFPLSSEVHLSLALLYDKLSLRRTARKYWRQYLVLAPEGGWSAFATSRLSDGSGCD